MADGISNLLSPQELQRLAHLSIQSRYVVEGTLAGRHRSHLKGASTEFADHRAYVTGDDPKRLDWKVLGRTDRYYIRRYEDETNLRVYLIIDRSASMSYTSGPPMKYLYACRLAASLGYVVVKARDSVGLYLYSDQIDFQAGARNSFAHLNNLVKALSRSQPTSTTQTAKTLHQVAEAVRRRALIILFSDLLDDPPEIIRALAHFRKQHHDVIIFHILDPLELDFSFKQGARFIDLETGETVVADPRGMATVYRQVFAQFLEQYRKPCAEMNIDYRLVRTDQEPARFVRSFLEERKQLSK
ncbi:MAG: DUF58 domain-containing protein [Lentisphaerae bacterium]|nr:DUF58 domain-containing protein [Lentisphaerota bacterium]